MLISGNKSVKKGQKNAKKCHKSDRSFSNLLTTANNYRYIFWALFDTFITRYKHSDMKFKFSGYFYPSKHFFKKSFLKIN